MTTYTATATREGNWWVLDVDNVGVTQCARLTEARDQIRGLIEAVTDTDVPDDTHIDIHLGTFIDASLQTVRDVAALADDLRDYAAFQLRVTAATLVRNQGLTQAEAAVVLGVSKQRITQLMSDPPRKIPINGDQVHELLQVRRKGRADVVARSNENTYSDH